MTRTVFILPLLPTGKDDTDEIGARQDRSRLGTRPRQTGIDHGVGRPDPLVVAFVVAWRLGGGQRAREVAEDRGLDASLLEALMAPTPEDDPRTLAARLVGALLREGRLRRRSVGCDIDRRTVRVAKERVAVGRRSLRS